MEAEYRKYQDIINIAGTGTIIFSVWSVFKGLALFILSRAAFRKAFGLAADGVVSPAEYAGVAVALALDLILRLQVGRGARLEARGRRAGNFYVIVAGVMALLYVPSVLFRAYGLPKAGTGLIDELIMLVIDATSMVILFWLLFSVRKVRKLRRILGKETGSLAEEKDAA